MVETSWYRPGGFERITNTKRGNYGWGINWGTPTYSLHQYNCRLGSWKREKDSEEEDGSVLENKRGRQTLIDGNLVLEE